jgi:hypothetical protein
MNDGVPRPAAASGASGRGARAARRALRLLLIATVAASAAGLCACIQPRAAFEPFSVVAVQVDVPFNLPRAGIRVSVSGSGAIAGDNDSAFTDSLGFAAIRTKVVGRHYIVARHQDYDITYGGTAANLGSSGPRQVFERGRLDIPVQGATVSPDFFFPFTGNNFPPQVPPRRVGMRPKVPGKARFIFIVEDSNVLRNTFAPTQPMPFGKVFMTGSFNNFNLVTEDVDPVDGAKEMFDDGSFQVPDGDDQIGDGVFTRVLDLPPGETTYAFLANSISIFLRDPYEESSKNVRIVARTPSTSSGNPNVLDVREFRASSILVTRPPP